MENMENFEEAMEEIDVDIERILSDGDARELSALKRWLFREGMRLKTEKYELKRQRDRLSMEKERFRMEVAQANSELETERRLLKQDQEFFAKKMDILKGGFAQLDEDRRKLDEDRLVYEAEKNVHVSQSKQEKLGQMLFQGVNSQLALKKRYKDLIKMYHPDNVAGDHEMVLAINKIYDEMRHDFETGKRA